MKNNSTIKIKRLKIDNLLNPYKMTELTTHEAITFLFWFPFTVGFWIFSIMYRVNSIIEVTSSSYLHLKYINEKIEEDELSLTTSQVLQLRDSEVAYKSLTNTAFLYFLTNSKTKNLTKGVKYYYDKILSPYKNE